MHFNTLGNTGLLVSELCLGTMTFGGEADIWKNYGALDQQQATEIVRIAIESGINFIDTADAYAEGRSEEMTGQALRTLNIPRDEVVIATKVFGPTGPGPNSRGSTRAHIIAAVQQSLKRLGVDHIDLYQMHGFDTVTPVEETLRALDTIVQQGLVRYIGVSNWAAWQIADALGVSDRLGLNRIASLQAYYTIAGRDLERELVPMMRAKNVGLMVWGPLASGLLTGKYPRHEKGDGRRTGFDFPPVDQDRAYAAIDAMRPMAEARSVSIAQIAIAWLLHQRVVTSVIIGARRPDQLIDNIAAVKVSLSADDLATLDAVTRLPSEYPGWMFDFLGAIRAAPASRHSG